MSDKIKIEKGVPVPAERRASTRYPFDDMEVGDSFFVPGRTAGQMSGSIGCARKRKPDRRYAARSIDDGVRVWRIK